MPVTSRRPILTTAATLTALPATAHRSRAIYDLERSVTIEGIVTEFEWANPHVNLHVEARTGEGEPVIREIENGSTTAMGRRGWTRGSFAPGDRVIVEASPSRDPDRYAAVVTTVTKSGVTWIGRGSLAPVPCDLEKSRRFLGD